jgi:trehalose 6-phosphate phosphatase
MASTPQDLAARAGRGGLFMDFDGTLSEIVPQPQDARPIAGARQVLDELSHRFAAVAVVSGRSAHQLSEWLGPSIEIWGLHGAERAFGGRVELSDAVAPYADAIDAARSAAIERFQRSDLEGAVVEDKGAMVALHYRTARDPDAAGRIIAAVADDLATGHGLKVTAARMVYELRPPIEVSKRQVVERRARELDLQAACFVGDDSVDLPAFDALDGLQSEGRVCLRVAVRSDESPPELIDRADHVVDGPTGALRFLQELLDLTTAA